MEFQIPETEKSLREKVGTCDPLDVFTKIKIKKHIKINLK